MIEYKVKVYKNRTLWYFNDKLHREDGAAIEYTDGHKLWYLNGKSHRENGLPAVEYIDGTKVWYVNGKRHREDGAAVEYTNGNKEWWLNGEQYSEEAFKGKTRKVKELTVKEITELLGYDVKIIK